MWIMLIKKLPTKISPPKLSMFWSQPYPDARVVKRQFETFYNQGRFDGDLPVSGKNFRKQNVSFFHDEDGNILSEELLQEKILSYMNSQLDVLYDNYFGFGAEDNWAKARKIVYNEETIRVFEREFSVLTHDKMSEYLGLTGHGGSHELVPDSVAEETLFEQILEGDLRDVFDAALMDGCTDEQAIGVALGLDVALEYHGDKLAEYPPLGWYRCKSEYAKMFCSEKEMEG